jgi:hypothetical protein
MNNPGTVPHHTITILSAAGRPGLKGISELNSVATSLWVTLVLHGHCSSNMIVLDFIATEHETIGTLISDISYMLCVNDTVSDTNVILVSRY